MTTPLRQRRAREALEAAQRATKKLPNRAARGDARGTDMTQGQQPEALVFANDRPMSTSDDLYQWAVDAEELIRAQHARIAELESKLEAIGAGGVEPLRKPAAAPQAVHATVPVAWRLTNTAFRKPRFEYHDTKESAEQRQAEFNRSVDDGGLHNLTPLYAALASQAKHGGTA